MQPRVLILRAPGTNCDNETAHAFQRAKGRPEIVHVRRLLESPRMLAEYNILCIPGGFSYGDDIASGRLLALQIQNHLAAALQEFKAAGKLILGICNGFQVLLRCGLLLDDRSTRAQPATLAANGSGKFEARWVRIAAVENQCVFLAGVTSLELPVAHAEGRFVARDQAALAKLQGNAQLVLRYVPQGAMPNLQGAEDRSLPYPENPNGSEGNVAGICDSTGRVLGLMPHPERHIEPTQHPRWTRGEAPTAATGLLLFQNAVNYFR